MSRAQRLLTLCILLALEVERKRRLRRPPRRFGGGSITAVTDHGKLTGLGDDDHTQYLPVDGSRAMTGNLTTRNLSPYSPTTSIGSAMLRYQHIYLNYADISISLKAANIFEYVADAGVQVEEVLLKDGLVDGVDVAALKPHALDSATYHSGSITDAQHGVRTLASAHDLPDLSGVVTDAQHGTKTTIPNAHHTPLIHEGFRAYLGSEQDIDTAIWTTVELDTEEFDDNNDFNTSTHTWTVPATGRYLLTFQLTFTNMADGTDVELAVRRSTPAPNNFVILFYRPGGAGYMGMSGASIADLVSGATVTMRIYQASGATKTLGASNAYTFLSAVRIK